MPWFNFSSDDVTPCMWVCWYLGMFAQIESKSNQLADSCNASIHFSFNVSNICLKYSSIVLLTKADQVVLKT